MRRNRNYKSVILKVYLFYEFTETVNITIQNAFYDFFVFLSLAPISIFKFQLLFGISSQLSKNETIDKDNA